MRCRQARSRHRRARRGRLGRPRRPSPGSGVLRPPTPWLADPSRHRAPKTQAEREGQLALAAMQSGQAALSDGDAGGAVAWLERALRYAPDDPAPLLSLSAARLAAGDIIAALAGFEAVAERCDTREAWLGAAVAALRLGRIAAAAAALAACLSRHRWDGSRSVADSVVAARRLPGWCALAADGTIAVGLRVPGRLTIRADGAELPTDRPVPATVRRIEVTLGDEPLLGSPIDGALIHRVEGVVGARDGGVEGWAWHPGDPDRDPVLRLTGSGRELVIVAHDQSMTALRPLTRPRRFAVPADALAGFGGPIGVTGADGLMLSGSPVDPGAFRDSAAAAARLLASRWPCRGEALAEGEAPFLPAVPAAVRGKPAEAPLRRARAAAVVVPVYRGLRETLACLEAVRRTVPPGTEMIVVDDASPEAALVTALEAQQARGAIRLLRLSVNHGFPGAANAGLRAACALPGECDVVLLNSDTMPWSGLAGGAARCGASGTRYRHRLAAVERCHHPDLSRPACAATDTAAGRGGPGSSGAAGGARQCRGRGGDPDVCRLLHVHPPRVPGAGGRVPRRPVCAGVRRGERFLPARASPGLAPCRGAGRLCGASGRPFLWPRARGADRAQHAGAGGSASRLPRADRRLDRGRSAAPGPATPGRPALARFVPVA